MMELQDTLGNDEWLRQNEDSIKQLLTEDETMKNGVLFVDLGCNGVPLRDCEIAYKGKYDNTRLYVLKEPEHRIFYAHAVEINSRPASEGDGSDWDNAGLEVNTLFTVTACYDRVKHLEFNRGNSDDMDGYLYCPPMADLIAMLQKVREIEIEICLSSDIDWRRERGKPGSRRGA